MREVAAFVVCVASLALAQEIKEEDPAEHFPLGITKPKELDVFRYRYVQFKWQLNTNPPRGSTAKILLDSGVFGETSPEAQSMMAFGVANGRHTLRIALRGPNDEDLGSSTLVNFVVERNTNTYTERIQGLEPTLRPYVAGQQDEFPNPDVTFVTAAINIGRRHGFATFEDDYIKNLQHILSLRWPLVIFIQKEYIPLIEPYLHSKVYLRETELDHLRQFKYYDEVQSLRVSPEWVASSKYRSGDDGRAYPARIELYNPLVMSKPFWLQQAARENPAKTKYVLWLDCGMCARRIKLPLDLTRMRSWMEDKFVIFGMDYGTSDGYDIHGFPHHAYTKLTGEPALVLLRGNIFGGLPDVIERVTSLYDDMLRVTLRGEAPLRDETAPLQGRAMGTEESVMTLAWLRNKHLFHVPNLSDNHLRFEMPCWMFGIVSADQPLVHISEPAQDSDVAVEAVTVRVNATHFDIPTDGGICVTWGEYPDMGYECADDNVISLTEVPAGDQMLRAELVSLDGVPITVSEYVHVRVKLSMSPTMDWDGVVLDSLQELGDYVTSLPGATGRAVVVHVGDPTPSHPLPDWSGHAVTLYFTRCCCEDNVPDTGDVQCRKNEDQDDASGQRTNYACDGLGCTGAGSEVEDGSLDVVVLVTPAPCRDGGVASLLAEWHRKVRPGGIVAGTSYYDAPQQDHRVKSAVDAFAEQHKLAVQTTQEMRGRSWLYIQPSH